MRIACPYCGPRRKTSSPISATPTVRRPDPAAPTQPRVHDYVYLRDNPAGPHASSGITAPAAAPGWW